MYDSQCGTLRAQRRSGILKKLSPEMVAEVGTSPISRLARILMPPHYALGTKRSMYWGQEQGRQFIARVFKVSVEHDIHGVLHWWAAFEGACQPGSTPFKQAKKRTI